MNLLKLSAAFSLLALVLSGCAGTIGTSSKGLEAPIELAAIKFASDAKEGGYKLVNTAELKKWMDEGKSVTILSALPSVEDRAFGLLPGAVNTFMPKNELELTPEDREHLMRIVGYNRAQTIVVYSGFVACRRSHIGAKMLVDAGYIDVYRYPAGIAGWRESGYGLAK